MFVRLKIYHYFALQNILSFIDPTFGFEKKRWHDTNLENIAPAWWCLRKNLVYSLYSYHNVEFIYIQPGDEENKPGHQKFFFY